MKTASKLLSAAFALAALASVALPTAQPAEAAGGPDIRASIDDIRVGDDTFVYAGIKNIGTQASGPIMVHRRCGYLQPGGVIKEVTAQPMQMIPSLAAGDYAHNVMYVCGKHEGQFPVSARVLAVSPGDVNTANNDIKKQTFQL